MADFAHLEIRISTKGAKAARDSVRGLDADVKKVADNTKKHDLKKPFFDTRNAVNALKGALGGLAAAAAVRELVQFSDAWTNAGNRLRIVTNTTQEFLTAQKDVLSLANETRSSFGATAELYGKLARSTEELNISHDELIGLTGTINMAFSASGATAAEAEGAIRQLGQALSSGALRGDEFNSIAEQAPAIMRAVADETGMAIGALRDFAATGGITAEIVVSALQNAADEIEGDFAETIATFGQKMEVAKNNVTAFSGGLESSTGVIGKFGDLMVTVSNNMDLVGAAATGIGVAFAAGFFPAIAGIAVPVGIGVGALAALLEVMQNIREEASDMRVDEGVASVLGVEDLTALDLRIGDVLRKMIELDEAWEGQTRQLRFFQDNDKLEQELDELMAIREAANAQMLAQDKKAFEERLALNTSGIDLAAVLNAIPSDASVDLNAFFNNLYEDAGDLNQKAFETTFSNIDLEAALNQIPDGTIDLNAFFNNMYEGAADLNAAALNDAFIAGMADFTNPLNANFDLGFDPIVPFSMVPDQTGIDTTVAAIAEVNEAYDQMLENIQSGWGNAIFNMLDGGEITFEAFFDTIKEAFFRMLSEMVAADLVNAVFGGNFSFSNTGGLIGAGVGVFRDVVSGGSSSPGTDDAGNVNGNEGGGGIFGTIASVAGGIVTGSGDFVKGVWDSATGIFKPDKEVVEAVAGGAVDDAGNAVAGFNFSEFGSKIVSGAITIGAGIAGSFIGNEVGGALSDKEAESNIGSTIGGTIGAAIGGPLGSFIGSFLGGIVDVFSGGDGYVRSNAGFFTGGTAENPLATSRLGDESTFAIDPFSSGFQGVGFAHRSTQAQAEEVIDLFRNIDAGISETIRAIGGTVDLSNASLSGTGGDGEFNTAGVFAGVGGKSTEADIDQQLLRFAKEVIQVGASGIDQGLKTAIAGSSSLEEISTLLGEAKTAFDEEQKLIDDAAAAIAATDAADSLVDPTITAAENGELAAITFSFLTDELKRTSDSMMLVEESIKLAANLTQKFQQVIDRWDIDGMPPTRT